MASHGQSTKERDKTESGTPADGSGSRIPQPELPGGDTEGQNPESNRASDEPELERQAPSLRLKGSGPQGPAGRYRRGRPPAWVASAVTGTQSLISLPGQVIRSLVSLITLYRNEIVTAVTSFAFHVVVGIILVTVLLPEAPENETVRLTTVNPEDPEPIEPVILENDLQPDTLIQADIDSTMKQMLAEIDQGKERLQLDSPVDRKVEISADDVMDLSEAPVLRGAFGGRSQAGRQASVRQNGGSAESEKAVNTGLTWLQRVQRDDGSWNFGSPGDAGQAGNLTGDTVGATSLALLTFLGGGHTHQEETAYRETVRKGLEHLLKQGEQTSSGLDMRGGQRGTPSLYIQGIATICLCEAAALAPKDKVLRRAASDAVKFVERSQDKVGGGWRYSPGDPGDLSVTGWQLMALQSARATRISVQSDTLQDARQFLRRVSADNGSRYRYMPDGEPRPSMTAVGLLCQMYMGWKRDKPELKAGVEHLASVGPSPSDIYYNYYATQVMHHWGGELWDQWNLKMREQLISTQIKDGPGAGSWDVTDPHGGQGGRIYQTALSVMTLEVYYRHLPLYRRFDSASAPE